MVVNDDDDWKTWYDDVSGRLMKMADGAKACLNQASVGPGSRYLISLIYQSPVYP